MRCPECKSRNSLPDNMRGKIQCSECLSNFWYAVNEVTYIPQLLPYGGEKRTRKQERTSAIAPRLSNIYRPPAEKEEAVRCINCAFPLNTGFCYTGTVLTGLQFGSKMVTETEPVLGTIETPFNLYIIGGQEHQIEKRFPYQGRKRGYICLYCSSNYHTIPIRDKAGNIVRHEPVVKLDPRPGYIGETARGSFIPNAPQAKRESHLPVRQLRFAPQRKEGRRG